MDRPTASREPDALVSHYEVVDLLDRLVEHTMQLLDVDAVGVLLADQIGALEVLASTANRPRFLELLQFQSESGPCQECIQRGRPVTVPDVAAHAHRWPTFAAHAQQHGYRSVHAVPLKFQAESIGVMNLLSGKPASLAPSELKIALRLADMATVAVLNQRPPHRVEPVAEQLQNALNSRVLIEQAKGILAEQGDLDEDAAFAVLRNYTRSRHQGLAEAARAVVNGTLTLQADGPPPRELGGRVTYIAHVYLDDDDTPRAQR